MAFFNELFLQNPLFQELEDFEERQNLINLHRRLRDTSNPFELPENKFSKIFRLSRELAYDLYTLLDEFMFHGRRSTFIPNHLKVLLTLNFYGYGSYQGVIGEDFNFACSQSTVSRIVDLVTNTNVDHVLPNKIKFPTTPEEIAATKLGFTNKFGFPDVIGCVDGTHIAIVSPPVEHPIYPAAAYYNRKGYTSINALIICDANLKITAINARYPGATHDAAIWQMSNICRHLRSKYFAGESNGWLLGDSGFPLQPWLLTPYEDAPANSPEARYTECHCRARNTIERLNGVLKSRFRCLLKHRVLHYLPPKAGKILYACAVLNNMCLEYNVAEIHNNNIEDEDEDEENDNENGFVSEVNDNLLISGRRIRNNLIQRYFV